MCPSQFSEIVRTFEELERLHQLNTELLEQLAVATSWLFQNNIPLPNAQTLYSLFNKSRTLLNEIGANEPKILQYNISRRNVTATFWKNETDGDVTEPRKHHQNPFVTSHNSAYHRTSWR